MAEPKKKNQKQKNPLIGNQAKPTVLDSTTKLDIDTNKVLIDNIIEAGLNSRLDIAALERFTTISNARDQIYSLIDTMCQDSSVSSIVRLYSEDVTEMSDSGHIVWCESADPKISMFVNYLLNVMNVDKKIFGWVYCLIKYGDVYLRLFRESEYADRLFNSNSIDKLNSARNVLNEDLNEGVNMALRSVNDQYSYYIEMVPDPSTMFELTRHGQTYGYIEVPNSPNQVDQASYIGGTTSGMANGGNVFNFQYKSGDVNVYQADDFVHACLEDNVSRFPETVDLFYDDLDSAENKRKTGSVDGKNGQSYTVRRGKSLLYDAYKIWREKALLESAILLSRITRAGIVRKVAVEVGDMPKEQVQQTLRRVKELFEQRSSYNADKTFSEYTSPGAVENFIYYATHNGQGNISVESVGGDFDPKQLTDLDWWNNKFYSSFGIPKQYFGWTDDGAGFNGGSSLTITSSVYAKGVKRVQNTILQAITDAINLILFNKGYKSYLNNFVLKMRAPLTQEELDFRANFTDRVNAISSVNSLFTDVEDKARRLEILKSLVSSLHLGDEINVELDKEIAAAEEARKKAEEEEANAAKAESEGDLSADLSEEPAGTADLDLAPMPDEELPKEESFGEHGETPLNEEHSLTEDDDDDLPTPEEADESIDFTENK